MQLVAGEAQSSEIDSDPDTWTCRLLFERGTPVSEWRVIPAARDQRQDCGFCFDYVESVENIRSASKNCTCCCRGLATVCTHLHSISYRCSGRHCGAFCTWPSALCLNVSTCTATGNWARAFLFFAVCASCLLRRRIVGLPFSRPRQKSPCFRSRSPRKLDSVGWIIFFILDYFLFFTSTDTDKYTTGRFW